MAVNIIIDDVRAGLVGERFALETTLIELSPAYAAMAAARIRAASGRTGRVSGVDQPKDQGLPLFIAEEAAE